MRCGFGSRWRSDWCLWASGRAGEDGIAVLRRQPTERRGRQRVRPATFTFLGFTHFLTKTRTGLINIVRTPSVKTRERFIRTVWIWLKANRHQSVWEQHAHLTKALNGYYQYFGLHL